MVNAHPKKTRTGDDEKGPEGDGHGAGPVGAQHAVEHEIGRGTWFEIVQVCMYM